ncbi:meiotic recombination protein [Dimargaris cristalligena]|uniref:Meiotic recombination protein n=1 Tax=Dimargaris cristalligena TaxID=215637 RepID=A0A4P9ZZ29_9FUNG|nr:meiotic recombination protein [Dimargaris cristalligena]|eukprot:RKP38050.1 meiotic recombination protein [Dimargaris cristalligena]
MDTEPENTLRLLLATDNHLGYLEKDPVRKDDSFLAFEEILSIAQREKVDMILLGGDLFHDNRPSRKALFTTMKLFRQYCMGDQPSAVRFCSDASATLENSFGSVNYQDPNLNVGIPVFTIHGNHDDPTGDGNLSAIDLLSVTGQLNYFGKSQQVDRVEIKPLLLQKGSTKLALYGLGNIRDERLHRTFLSKKVNTIRPETTPADWFNLLVLHQNRIAHGPTNFIPEEFLDSLFDLVMWGHEHECRIDPEPNSTRGFAVTQPGSSVATSLCDGESRTKHVALLSLHQRDYRLRKIRLKFVRPFLLEDVALRDIPGLEPLDERGTMNFLRKKVDDMIERTMTTWLSEMGYGFDQNDLPEGLRCMQLPLIRLRVDYSGGFTSFNPQRFGMHYTDRVANPKDIIYYHRRKVTNGPPSRTSLKSGTAADQPASVEDIDSVGIEDLINEFLEGQVLDVFIDRELNEAVRLFVDKEEPHAIVQ